MKEEQEATTMNRTPTPGYIAPIPPKKDGNRELAA